MKLIQRTTTYWHFWRVIAYVFGAIQRFAIVRMGYHNTARYGR